MNKYELKPYYKKNGFYDRLESLSNKINLLMWTIDNALSGDCMSMWYLTRIKRFALLDEINECILSIGFPSEVNESDSEYLKLRKKHEIEYRELYNREKYWWMAKK